jgi:hypothetical protein
MYPTQHNNKGKKKYFETLYSNKLENLKETDKYLDAYDLPKLNQEHIENLNIYLACTNIKTLIKSLSTKKSPRQDGFHC